VRNTYNQRYFFVFILLIIFLIAAYFAVNMADQEARRASELTAIEPMAPLVERPPINSLKATEPVKVDRKLMINTATASEIANQLKGIGNKTAQLIVDYRDANGPFESLVELEAVKGIGMAKIEANREIISFAPKE
jgi:competence ComEA-like helix-hairpin-helix protein